MFTIFRHNLARSRGQILGWGLSLAVLGAYLIRLYDTLASQMAALTELLKKYPPELMAFFGDMSQIFTPAGYLNTEFFSYMPLILGIFAVLAGSGLLAGDEENGTLDLLLAYPISRTALFMGRSMAYVITSGLILGIIWVAFMIAVPGTTLHLNAGEVVLPFLSLFAVMMIFGMLALLLSMLLPSRRMAAMTAGLVLVASFFITSLARVDESLKSTARFSPLNYYQGGEAISGLNGGWLAGLMAFSLLFLLLAWWRFERRDVRMGGEGGWGLPSWLNFSHRKPVQS